MDRDESKKIVEALLFVSEKPVSVETLSDVIKNIDAADVRTIIEELNAEYSSTGRSFQIKEIAGGFQMLTDPVYSRWISILYKKGPDRLSGPSLETLAIIAYKQPLTRSDIEAIRGVNVDGVLHTLEERKFIKMKGRLEAPGRPILYGTTTEFLQHFGLRSLEELPKLKEFQESDLDFVRDKNKAEVVDRSTGKLHIQAAAQEAPAQEAAPQEAPVQTVPVPETPAQDATSQELAAQEAPAQQPEPVAAESDVNKEKVNGPEELAK
jgi:segregation and condensation protein B